MLHLTGIAKLATPATQRNACHIYRTRKIDEGSP